MPAITIEKDGKSYTVLDESKESQYQKSKRLRKEEREKKKLGFKKIKRKRDGKGNRGGAIATIPICELNSEQLNLLITKTHLQANGMYVLPDRYRVTIDMKKYPGTYSTMIGDEFAKEVIAMSPDLKKIATMLDPMAAKRGNTNE